MADIKISEEQLKGAVSRVKKYGYIAGSVVTAFILYQTATINVDSGEKVRIQNSLTGSYTWEQTEGIHFKVPFFSKVARYPDVTTIAITDDEQLLETSGATRSPLLVNFADNYGGVIEASFRVKLPTSASQLEAMHQDIKSYDNLIGNTYLPFAKDMINLTTDQFLAQDFMQGGKGAFKQRLQEQSDLGMRVTKREKIEIEGNVADQSTNKTDRSQASTAKQYTYKVISETDKDGKLLRRPHSLTKYGITVVQVDLGEFLPNPDLNNYVMTIKQREKESADLIASQKLEREKAITEQLRGDRNRIVEKNKALMEKDREVVQGQKQVELAKIQAEREIVERKKVADLAIIDKKKELQQATDNEAIEKANFAAAKYKAQADKEIGLAQAEVTREKYKAINPQLYTLEKQVEITENLRDAFRGTNVTMPTNYIVNGQQDGKQLSSNMDVMMNLLQLDKLDQLNKINK